MPKLKKAPGALAYSYIRFSSPEQAKGDSLRRQTDYARAWAEANGVKLDESLTFRDLGRSAFTGSHRTNPDRNALAAFLKLVEAGRVPRGSFLIIENLDRLTREHIRPALGLFLGLIDAGVRIVTLGQVPVIYDDETLNADATPLILAIVDLTRGHKESALKSDRVGKAWKAKKQEAARGVNLTARLPAWVELRDGKRVVRKEAKKAIERVFELAADGCGSAAIVQRLTAEGFKPFGDSGRWVRSYVALLLTDRRVIGEYQPRTVSGDPDGPAIPDYYPPVIPADLFWRANGERKNRTKRTTKGKGEGNFNYFAGLMVRAGHAEDKYYVAQRVENRRAGRAGGKPNRVYINVRSAEGTAPCESFPVHVFDNAVIGRLVGLNPADIIGPAPGVQAYEARKAELEAVEERIKGIEAELAEADPGTIRILTKVAGGLEEKRVKLVEEVATLRADLSNPRADNLKGMSDAWAALQAVGDQGGDVENAKLKLRSSIKRLVKCVHCLFRGYGKKRVAFVQVEFWENPKVQTFAIDYWPAIKNQRGGRPEQWSIRAVEQAAPEAAISLATVEGVTLARRILDSVHGK